MEEGLWGHIGLPAGTGRGGSPLQLRPTFHQIPCKDGRKRERLRAVELKPHGASLAPVTRGPAWSSRRLRTRHTIPPSNSLTLAFLSRAAKTLANLQMANRCATGLCTLHARWSATCPDGTRSRGGQPGAPRMVQGQAREDTASKGAAGVNASQPPKQPTAWKAAHKPGHCRVHMHRSTLVCTHTPMPTPTGTVCAHTHLHVHTLPRAHRVCTYTCAHPLLMHTLPQAHRVCTHTHVPTPTCMCTHSHGYTGSVHTCVHTHCLCTHSHGHTGSVHTRAHTYLHVHTLP